MSSELATARQRKLSDGKVSALSEALRVQEPWLERASRKLDRSPSIRVTLLIHERLSAQAILKVVLLQLVHVWVQTALLVQQICYM